MAETTMVSSTAPPVTMKLLMKFCPRSARVHALTKLSKVQLVGRPSLLS